MQNLALKPSLILHFLYLLYLGSSLFVSAASAEAIGAVLALKGDVSIKNKAGSIAAYQGYQLAEGDEISTASDGWVQIALTDQSLFSIPANSNFRLEDFQQDSASQRLFTRLLSGAVRFISGQTASTEDDAMQIKFGTVAAAIRGTSGVIEYSVDDTSKLTLLSGRIDLLDNNANQIRQLSRSGWGVNINTAGIASSILQRPAEELSALLAKTASNTSSNQLPPQAETPTQDASETVPPERVNVAALFSAEGISGLTPHQRELLDSLAEDKRNDSTNNQISLDEALIDYALSGGEPLWSSYFDDGYIGNPPTASHPVDYQLYQTIYNGIVAERYQGRVNFSADDIPLVAVNGFNAQGLAGFSAEFDFDTIGISGQFWVKDIHIGPAQFDNPAAVALSLPALTDGDLLVDIKIAETPLTAAPQNGLTPQADASLHLSLGSITDGQSVIDGRLGLFSVAVIPQDGDAPALAAQAILAGQEN